MSRSQVASKAMRWVIYMETSTSVDRQRPIFERWLLADRQHWVAYMAARKQWSHWQGIAARLSNDHSAVTKVWDYIERRKAAARAHRQVLWRALGISLLVLILL